MPGHALADLRVLRPTRPRSNQGIQRVPFSGFKGIIREPQHSEKERKAYSGF